MTLPPPRPRRTATPGVLPNVERISDLVAGPNRDGFLAILGAWVSERRWFRSKARRIRGVDVIDVATLGGSGMDTALFVLEFRYVEGPRELYAVPVARVGAEDAALPGDAVGAIIVRLGSSGDVLVDAMRMPATAEQLVAAIGGRRCWQGASGTLVARPTPAFGTLLGDSSRRLIAAPGHVEQSNTSVVLGDRLILKVYRRLEEGLNPELEVGGFLTDRGFPHVPAVAGWLDYERAGAETATLAMLQEYRASQGDAWTYTLGVLGDYLDASATRADPPAAVAMSAKGLLALAAAQPPHRVRDAMGAYLDQARLLGERTAALHLALGSDRVDPAFAPEAGDAPHERTVLQSVLSAAGLGFDLLARRMATLPDEVRADAEAALALRERADGMLARLLGRGTGGRRIRIHGDYHLGQVLFTGRDFVIIDFEGEPGRPLRERRIKRSPLVDVAGMLRSFSYAASGSLIQRDREGSFREGDTADLDSWAGAWTAWASGAFLAGYRAVVGRADILPADDAGWAVLLDAFLLEKAFYELEYELNNRPAWVGIPLRGIVGLLEGWDEVGP